MDTLDLFKALIEEPDKQTKRWLFHYELWVGTGIWHGGGIEHGMEAEKEDADQAE